ncbi:hypothetical protein EXIGLDRAFT_732338 [Exidia glandulosa HHB12029]|uniref:Uncharacterized protein n=1 Tax=Exidia glandulosa HHB12029 TaxID=1314781 RepID=A0A165KS01_EXIGL|nr:hypothetical protein EXIGLDRAFT_732338 [Exidia glandulosa HHB12029]
MSSKTNGNGKVAEREPSPTTPSPSGLHVFHTRRRSSTGQHGHVRHEPAEPATAWFDAPLALALAPTLGSFMTGGEHVRDFLLLLIMLFYLHQLIKVPWDLYTLSRPRRHQSPRSPDEKPEHTRAAELAHSELHSLSLFYLALTILSPLIGAYLLRTISASLLGQDYISWFSTVVFVLAAGIRPWRHLIFLLRNRTLELQDAAHDGVSSVGFSPDRRSMVVRLEQLEEQLAEQVAAAASAKAELARTQQALEQSHEELEKLIRRSARKAEAERQTQAQRLETLEAKIDALSAKRAMAPVVSSSFPSVVPSYFGLSSLFGGAANGGAPVVKTRRSVKHRSRKHPHGLTRIPEEGELLLDGDEDDDESDDGSLEWYERAMQVAFAPVWSLRLLFLFIVQMVRSVFFS